MSNAPDPNSPDVRPPFWRHRTYYLVLKLVVLAAAALLTLGVLRGFWS
jgi:hypothetical protein